MVCRARRKTWHDNRLFLSEHFWSDDGDTPLAVAPQPAPQVVQVRQEQRRVPTLLRPALVVEDLPGPPVDRPGDVPLLCCCPASRPRPAPLDHPHRADLGLVLM